MLTFDGAARDSDSKVKAAILDWFNPDFHALGGVGFDVVLGLVMFCTQKRRSMLSHLLPFASSTATGRKMKKQTLFLCLQIRQEGFRKITLASYRPWRI